MKQLYEVGEPVLAEFKNYPENNGEYVVTEVLTPEQAKEEFPEFIIMQAVYYRLSGLTIIGPKNGGFCDCAGQPALRKKHEPGQMGYKELMTSLKNSVLEWN